MAYSPPNETQILANMINTYTALTPIADDLNRGSVVRSLFTAFAIELKRFYTDQAENTVATQREAGYGMFNFQLLQPQAAYTIAQFSVPISPTVNVTVPSGYVISKTGTTVQYQTVGSYVWTAGSLTANIGIVCTQTGSVGNTQNGTITKINTGISGLPNLSVTNLKAVISGSDLETDQERAVRFTDFLSSIHRGDINALQYGARQAKLLDEYGYVVEQVVKSLVVEGSGFNTIYIDNGTYDTSDSLLAQCQQVINGYVDTNGNFVIGYKAAGIPSTVQIATNQTQSIVLAVTPSPGYSLNMITTPIIYAITSLIQSLNIGDTLYLKDIGLAVGNTPGVLNYVVTTPSADVIPSTGFLLKLLSTPTITQL